MLLVLMSRENKALEPVMVETKGLPCGRARLVCESREKDVVSPVPQTPERIWFAGGGGFLLIGMLCSIRYQKREWCEREECKYVRRQGGREASETCQSNPA